MNLTRQSLFTTAAMVAGWAACLPAEAALREANGTGVKVEAEYILPSAGRSVNETGTVGNFGTLNWVGRRSSNASGTVVSTSEAPAVLFGAPTSEISLASDWVPENQPVGTVVGALSVTHMTSPTFSLTEDAGGRFALSGINLTTGAILDHEANATRQVRVRATDPNGGYVEKDFALAILDDTGEDADSDGLSEAEENALGTSDLNADTDGDGFSDAKEKAAGSDPLDASSLPAWLPTNFSLVPGEVAENRPAGTFVGKLSFSDPDGNRSYAYALVAEANGSTLDNGLFAFDANGSLTTTAQLDYEVAAERRVRAQVKDDFNRTAAATLAVKVLDVEEATDANDTTPTTPVVENNDTTTEPVVDHNVTEPDDPGETPEPDPGGGLLDSLRIAGGSVEENLPVGTVAATFSVVDPDASRVYLFSIVSGGEGYFSMDVAGALRTTRELDFEERASHSILVRAESSGVIFQKSFEVRVVDAFAPIVETYPTKAGATEGVLLMVGAVLDAGSSAGVSDRGFVFGRKPDPVIGGAGVTALPGEQGEGDSFVATPRDLLAGKRYYYRAFASNGEGISYGTQERFTATREPTGPKWAKAVASGQAADWWRSPWFGSFYLARNGWLRHEKLGWLFSAGDGGGGVWLWQENLGWVWTGEGIYPYLFQNKPAGWHYLMGEVGGRVFLYRYRDGAWIDVEEGRAHNDVSSP